MEPKRTPLFETPVILALTVAEEALPIASNLQLQDSPAPRLPGVDQRVPYPKMLRKVSLFRRVNRHRAGPH